MLSDQQQAAVDIIGTVCSQRPMPARLAGGGGVAETPTPDGATPLPAAPLDGGPLSPGAAEAAESSFAGTSFEDVSLQVGAGRAGCCEGSAASEAGRRACLFRPPTSPAQVHPPAACLPPHTSQNASDFYRWLGELEAARSSETEGKFRRYGAALEGHLAAADALLADVKEVRRVTPAGV